VSESYKSVNLPPCPSSPYRTSMYLMFGDAGTISFNTLNDPFSTTTHLTREQALALAEAILANVPETEGATRA